MLAVLQGVDVILCQITGQGRSDNYSVALDGADFASGGLNQSSKIRPNRLFTADEGIGIVPGSALTAPLASRQPAEIGTEDGGDVRRPSLSREDVEYAAGGDGNALPAIDVEGDGIGGDSAAGLEVPKRLAGLGVEREEVALVGA